MGASPSCVVFSPALAGMGRLKVWVQTPAWSAYPALAGIYPRRFGGAGFFLVPSLPTIELLAVVLGHPVGLVALDDDAGAEEEEPSCGLESVPASGGMD